MTKATYQLITLGKPELFPNSVSIKLVEKIQELGMSENMLEFIHAGDFDIKFTRSSPSICIYYGSGIDQDIDLVKRLNTAGVLILPIYRNDFIAESPKVLHAINGIQLNSEADSRSLINIILENFGLLRKARRLFISYRRKESRSIAIQLYEKLEEAGFDVFLDTHSIRKGDNFQDELWHRLVDTDVVVLLNTPDFLTSQWTTEELAKANDMSIGILQVIWPYNTSPRTAELTVAYPLQKSDFTGGDIGGDIAHLEDSTVVSVIDAVENLRARSLAARQDNLITEFLLLTKMSGVETTLHSTKYLTVNTPLKKEVIIIPTIGVPDAFRYHESKDIIELIRSQQLDKIYLLYDHRNIREKWIKHLNWLDDHLPVSSVKITEVDKWVKSL